MIESKRKIAETNSLYFCDFAFFFSKQVQFVTRAPSGVSDMTLASTVPTIWQRSAFGGWRLCKIDGFASADGFGFLVTKSQSVAGESAAEQGGFGTSFYPIDGGLKL